MGQGSFDRDTFLAERKAMLLSLNPQIMRAYLRKYGEQPPEEGRRGDEVCMISMHKARCAAGDIPEAEKAKSRFWLRQRGMKPGILS